MTLMELLERMHSTNCSSCESLLQDDEVSTCKMCGEPICDDCRREYVGHCWNCYEQNGGYGGVTNNS